MKQPPFDSNSHISLNDNLDAWLNARVAGGHHDHSAPECESLAGTAHEFHAWADDAQQRDSAAEGPADDLWNRILTQQGVALPGRGRNSVHPPLVGGSSANVGTHERNAARMDTLISPPIERIAPQSNRTRKANDFTRTRSGGWINAIAALLLLLSLGGGAYLARNGGFGFGGGDDECRYAAQAVLPGASPEASAVVETDHICDVPGYTEEQAWHIVMNPDYGYQLLMSGEEPEGPPSELWENVGGAWNIVEAWGVHRDQGWPPEQSVYDEMATDANRFWACLNTGTSLQVWSLMDPTVMQSEILMNFKVLRSEDDIRGYISTFGNMRYSAALSHHFPDFGGIDNPVRSAVASPNPATSRVIEFDGRQSIAWVRMVRDDEANVAAQTYLIMREVRPGVWVAAAHVVEGGLG
jgi:hypothetical protein